MLVIDSVAALVPRAEIEGEMGDSHMGLQARLMSQALRKLTGNLNKSRTVMIFINQLREKIGVMFGSPETTPGGRALKFYSSVRLDIRRVETLKDGPDAIGNRARVKVVKNKVAPPFKQAEFDIMYGKGISREGSLLDVGVDLGIVKKSGAWFTYEGEQLGQGREKVKQFLSENLDLMVEISEKIRQEVLPEEEADAARRRARPRPARSSSTTRSPPTSDPACAPDGSGAPSTADEPEAIATARSEQRSPRAASRPDRRPHDPRRLHRQSRNRDAACRPRPRRLRRGRGPSRRRRRSSANASTAGRRLRPRRWRAPRCSRAGRRRARGGARA